MRRAPSSLRGPLLAGGALVATMGLGTPGSAAGQVDTVTGVVPSSATVSVVDGRVQVTGTETLTTDVKRRGTIVVVTVIPAA